MCGVEALVAIESNQRVESERRAQRQRISRKGIRRGHHERKGGDVARRHSRKCAPLANGLAHTSDVGGLQIPKAAVNRLEMVERRGRAEIAALDECYGQAALRGVIRDREAVDAAADDEEIEVARGQPREISYQAGTIL